MMFNVLTTEKTNCIAVNHLRATARAKERDEQKFYEFKTAETI